MTSTRAVPAPLLAAALAAAVVALANRCTPDPVPAFTLAPVYAVPDSALMVARTVYRRIPECWAVGCPEHRLAHAVLNVSRREGVDPLRVARLIRVESGGDSTALGRPIRVRAGARVHVTRAVGLGQIVPELWLGVFPECGEDLIRVHVNVCYTVMIWKYYRDRHGTLTAAALGYNGCRRPDCAWYARAVLAEDYDE